MRNLESIAGNRNSNSDNEVSIKKYNDDSIREGTVVRFDQKLQNYLKVPVGNDTYNLNKYDKIQKTDTTENKFPNIGSDLLQKCHIKCNDNNKNSKVGNFIKSIITNSPTGY